MYCGPAYVATMNDDFLLGLHFMKATKCDLLMSESCIRFGGEHGEKVPAVLKRIEHRDYQISRVVMVHRVVVPPNTIKVAQVKLVDSVDEDRMFCVEPHMKNKGLLISATVTLGKSKVPVQIVNDLDQFVVLKAGHSVGIATEIHEIIGIESERGDLKGSFTTDCSQSEKDSLSTPSKNCPSPADCSQSEEDSSSTPLFQETDCSQSAQNPLSPLLQKPDCYQSANLLSTSSSDKPDCSQSDFSPLIEINDDCGQSDTKSFKFHPPKELDIGFTFDDGLSCDSTCEEVAVLHTETESGTEFPRSETVTSTSVRDHIPNYMNEMFDKSTVHLTQDQTEKFGKLLLEFVSIFAKHDLDLGCMKGVEHHINTGDHPPVKQRLRCTPLGFEGEEEKHLQKLLDAGIIKPSTSEWASPTVLI